ncbi:carcinoembryonic antigen-related cell adhesion molecule 5-like, partial [Clarias magur]
KPKPELTSSPKGDVLTGNSVTLYCTLNVPSIGWKFYWYKDGSTETDKNTYTIRSVIVSDRGGYQCRAGRGTPVYYTEYSDELQLDVTESPKPVVIINPDTQVYRGERVTYRCNLQTGGDTEWTYSWYKNDNTQLHHTTQEFSIDSVRDSDEGKYTCKGTRSDSQLSQISDAVTLSVSEKTKPELTSDLKGDVLTRNSVTLYCTLKLQSAGWKIYWITPTQSTETETETHYSSYYYYYTIISVSVSDGGQYRCRAGRGNPVYYTHYSDALWVNVIDSPKPVVIITLDTHVFRGERVTVRCDIQTGGDTEWTYSWYKNNNTQLQSTTQEISISSVRDSDEGKYTCRGRRRDSQLSQISDAVTLSVSEKPKPELTSSPKGDVLTGNSVTLTCTLNVPSAGWNFYWIKDGSTKAVRDTHTYTIRSVSVSDGGQYRCRAGRGNPVYYTHYSDALWVNVIEIKPVVIIKTHTQVFSGERVTFRCDIQTGGDTEWTYSWYKNNNTHHTTLEFSISSVRDSDGGKYTCRGTRRRDSQLSQMSDPVKLSVSDGDVILESPVHPVTEGNPLTLRCLNRSKISDSGADFYLNDSVIQSQTTGEMTISSVSKSDEGFYHCTHPERGESPKSWVSVRGFPPVLSHRKAPLSVLKLLSSVVAASPYVLVTIILAVKCYRAR